MAGAARSAGSIRAKLHWLGTQQAACQHGKCLGDGGAAAAMVMTAEEPAGAPSSAAKPRGHQLLRVSMLMVNMTPPWADGKLHLGCSRNPECG